MITGDKKEVAERLNTIFTEAMEKLGIETYALGNSDGAQPEIMDQYNNHPSITEIKEYVNEEHNFFFSDLSSKDLEKQILELDTKKANIEEY